MTEITEADWDEMVEQITIEGEFDERDLEAMVMAKAKVTRAAAKRLIRDHDRQQRAEIAREIKAGVKFEGITTGYAAILKAEAEAKRKIN
jgi:hypothetical protein